VKAYIVADIEMKDPVAYEAYRRDVPAMIAAYGGRYLVRGGATRVLEGDWGPRRMVILEFPSMQQAEAFYGSAEYRALKAIRIRASDSKLVAVEGC
jgi:uncharacterized protein (DUF1330 family)